jgi:hypothetical protein
MNRSTQAMRLAARQAAVRPARATRAFATGPPPPPPAGSPAPNPTKANSSNSTTLYLLIGSTIAGVGAWYYIQVWHRLNRDYST